MADVRLSEVLTAVVPSGPNVAADDMPGFANALGQVGILLLGWYPSARFGREEMTAWSLLLGGLDPDIFVPAAVQWAQEHPDWPPTAPQFRKCVEEMTRRRANEIVRRRTEEMLAATEAQLLEEVCTGGENQKITRTAPHGSVSSRSS